MALRNALAVSIPLAIGIEMGNSLAAVALAIGALNVAYADGRDSYLSRARRLLLWSLLTGVAVFVGSISGLSYWAAIVFAAGWAFAAGMMVGVNARTGDLGLNTLVTVIVFAARGADTLQGAFYSGLLVFAGGCIQTLFALLFWPFQRSRPQMLAIGQTFERLAAEVNPDLAAPRFDPLRAPNAKTEETLAALGIDHTVEGERFRLLFDQADRLRLSIYLLKRLRDELGEEDNQSSEVEGDAAEDLDSFLAGTSKVLSEVAQLLITLKRPAEFPTARQEMLDVVERAQVRRRDASMPLGEKIAAALDVISGQLRLVIQLADHSTAPGEAEYLKSVESKPARLQVSNWLPIMRANFTWRSPIFRHAVRLSAAVAVADVIQRGISWQRAYWIPMTVAVILKPDFATTFSRGTLRLGGTIAGLIMATLIYHSLPQSGWTQFFLVGVFAFLLRYLGPANYGVFTVAISGLIVFLLAATGVSPAQVILLRGVNTIAGGLLALTAYALWPTWERFTVSESLAEMLDAGRTYFRQVSLHFTGDDPPGDALLNEARNSWRLKRSAAEGAVDRVLSEPGSARAKTDCLRSILASSFGLGHAVMGLEASLIQKNNVKTAPLEFEQFARDVEFTLYFLSGALRGSAFAYQTLPQLREDYRRMIDSPEAAATLDQYVVAETDRLTVSLNPLREQVARYGSGC